MAEDMEHHNNTITMSCASALLVASSARPAVNTAILFTTSAMKGLIDTISKWCAFGGCNK